MANWSQADANALLTELAKIAEKVVDARLVSVVRTMPATVKSISGRNITVLPYGFTDTSSQYVTVKNYTDISLVVGNTVWINYWGENLTNSYLSPASF